MLEKEKAASGDGARRFFSSAWTAVLLLSGLLCAAGIVFRAQLASAAAWGFKAGPAGQLELTALLTAVLMPHLLFVNVSALFTAALNSARRFFLPALTAASFSLAVIALLAAFHIGLFPGLDERGKLVLLAAAASASGLLQALTLLPALRKEGFSPALSAPAETLRTAPLLLAAAPAAFTLAQDQVSMLINTLYASFLPAGAVTAIYNSSRLVQFPVSLFAAAAASVSLPELALRGAAGDSAGFRRGLAPAMAASWLVMLPAALGIAVTALPVCAALFEHGRFSPEQTRVTADALFWLALGLPAYGFNKVSASAMYAMGRGRAPLLIVTVQLALNAALCPLFMHGLGAGGLMLATSVSSWAAALAFAALLRRAAGFDPLSDLPVLKPAAAAGAAALAALLLCRALAAAGPLAQTAAAVPAAVLVYFCLLRAFKVEERKLITGGRF